MAYELRLGLRMSWIESYLPRDDEYRQCRVALANVPCHVQAPRFHFLPGPASVQLR